MSTDLLWGETPFDHLSKEESLLLLQKMYSALVSAESVLSLISYNQTSAFWGPEGSGRHSIEKIKSILNPIHAGFDRENIYRSFFRYANDLLFPELAAIGHVGFGWSVCSICGKMVGTSYSGKSANGKPCKEIVPTDCEGVFRPLTWDDLKPSNERE